MSASALIDQPKRGPGNQTRKRFAVSSFSYSWSWGAQPAEGRLTYIPTKDMPLITVGAWLELTVPGGPRDDDGKGQPIFFGVMKGGSLLDTSGNVVPTTRSSGGNQISIPFVDTREYLKWDCVFGCFNKAEVRLVGNRRVKRYWHILPENFGRHRKTWTDVPLTAVQILNYIFTAPSVETPWTRGYHPDQNQWPVYDIDCMSGRKLDEVVQEISDRMGLVFTLQTVGKIEALPFNLLWARKGEGTSFTIPPNSDNVDLRYELSGGPARVIVIGDRNKYLILNLGLVPDWNRNWEEVWDVDLLADDLFANDAAFNAIAGDTEQIIGRQLAAARARDITVREYAALRAARDGKDFSDYRRFATRMRMDMPAALYLKQLVFRSFRPPDFVKIRGEQVPTVALNVVEELCAGVNFDPETGKMTAVLDPDEDTLATAGGNGFALVQGYQVGTELLRAIRPDRFNLDQFTQGQSQWKPMTFQVDDTGSETGAFVLFDDAIIQVDGLVKIVNGHAVLNAAPTFQIPKVLACLTFEADRFLWEVGTQGGKDETVQVGGLRGEYIVDAASASSATTEVPYADGKLASLKAREIADVILKQQWFYYRGGYQLKLKPGETVPQLTNMLDRVTVEFGPNGQIATVELTGERPPRVKELERDYDRKVQMLTLLPGQKELRETANQMRIAAQAFRQSPGIARQIGSMLHGRLGGRADLTPLIVDAGTGTFEVGTPLWKPATSVGPDPNNPGTDVVSNTRATMPSASSSGTPHFVGVTVRDKEKADGTIRVQSTGEMLARVMGPVAVEDTVGRADGMDYLKKVDDDTGAVGRVMQAIGGTEVKLVTVQTGGGGGGGNKTAAGVWG
jgi:hypothetical protein